jgi:predicted thioesterase
MKDSLTVGLSTTNRITVDDRRTIDFMGAEGRVYATPELVRDIENTCRDFLMAHCEAGEDSVGTRIELDHLAATPLGMGVEITAWVIGVEGRRVTFEFSARDNVEEVARGKHARFVVDTLRTMQRLKAKAERAKQE